MIHDLVRLLRHRRSRQRSGRCVIPRPEAVDHGQLRQVPAAFLPRAMIHAVRLTPRSAEAVVRSRREAGCVFA
jgi:hypothetical protein